MPNETENNPGLVIHKKLSPATIMGAGRRPPKAGTREWWYRIAGRAIGYLSSDENSAYGTYVVLHGEFQAVRLDTGEVFTAGKCFLPAGVADLIASRLDAGEQKIDFVFDIGAEPSKREPDTKYEYIVRDPSADIRTSMLYAALASRPLPTGKMLPPPTTATPQLPAGTGTAEGASLTAPPSRKRVRGKS